MIKSQRYARLFVIAADRNLYIKIQMSNKMIIFNKIG